ncbi:MAG: M81 family metallopeptidase, partial [Candidatus Latescibacteria bacterium]|nr:M81 family metallopeptidase [Candidatus Latescibacterota bacterium]
GLVHETHTFLAEQTHLAGFEAMVWVRGQEMLDRCRGDASPMGGGLEVADASGWHVLPSRYGAAMPSGTVTDTVLEGWWEEVRNDLDAALVAGGLDGVLLILHGAMVFASYADGEGEVLRRVRDHLRERLGDTGKRVPVAADLDLHANTSDTMAAQASVLTAYRKNPHTDARDAGMRAAQLLDRLMRSGEETRIVRVAPPVIYSPRGTGTDTEPMISLQRSARQLEADHPDLLEVCVLGGFAYADIDCVGVSFLATTAGDAEAAADLLQPLAEEALARCDEGNPLDPPIDEVMGQVLASGQTGPIGLIEPSDNIGGGTPGDGTGILDAFLRFEVDDAVVILNDVEAAAACHGRSIGDHLTLPLGGKVDRFHGGTITLEVVLENLTDGRFDLENERSHLASLVGRHVDMGPSAVVRAGGIRLLLTTHKTPPMDLGQLRSQGIVPEQLYMVGIKAAVSHKAAYDPILTASFYVDTPGLGSSDLRRFPYANLTRAMRPLDG